MPRRVEKTKGRRRKGKHNESDRSDRSDKSDRLINVVRGRGSPQSPLFLLLSIVLTATLLRDRVGFLALRSHGFIIVLNFCMEGKVWIFS